MISIGFDDLRLRLKQENEKTLVFDIVRRKWIFLTPEEHVRQYIILYLVEQLHYPVSLIAVEKKIMVGKMAKRFDIVIFDRSHSPWMLVECKEPAVEISEVTLFQLVSYHSAISARYWLLTNGHQHFCAEIVAGKINWLGALPLYNG